MPSPTVLVIGANGQIGSATLRAAIKRGYPTIAYLRTPSKLPADLQDENVQVVQGNALEAESIRSAIQNNGKIVDAVVVAAPMGDMRGRRSGYEQIAENAIRGVKEAQKEKGADIKLWLMAGAAVLEHPEIPGTYASDLMPMTFYPEYAHTLAFLEQHGKDVNWSMNCPALIQKVGTKPAGPLVESFTTPPLWQAPSAIARLIPFRLGYAGNTMYNWVTQKITFDTLGEYMIDNLQPDERLKHKRVGVLEDSANSGR